MCVCFVRLILPHGKQCLSLVCEQENSNWAKAVSMWNFSNVWNKGNKTFFGKLHFLDKKKSLGLSAHPAGLGQRIFLTLQSLKFKHYVLIAPTTAARASLETLHVFWLTCLNCSSKIFCMPCPRICFSFFFFCSAVQFFPSTIIQVNDLKVLGRPGSPCVF